MLAHLLSDEHYNHDHYGRYYHWLIELGAASLHQTADQTNAAAAVAGALEFGAGVSTKSSFRIHSVMAIAVIVASSSVAT